MKVFELRLSICSPHPSFAFSARGFIDALNQHIRKQYGGACHGEATDALLIGQVRASSLESFMSLTEAYAEKVRQQIPDLKLLLNEAPQSVLTREQEHLAETLSAEPSKLTRKYFLALPAGTFLASNIWRDGREAFAEYVAATTEERDAQWKRIVASGAAQRLCRVFPTESHFLKYSSEMRSYFGLPPLNPRTPATF